MVDIQKRMFLIGYTLMISGLSVMFSVFILNNETINVLWACFGSVIGMCILMMGLDN